MSKLIIYSPSNKYASTTEFANIAVGIDCQIMDYLLENFELDIAYQPHPDLRHDLRQGVQGFFANNPRVLNVPVSQYNSQYNLAATMVTDFSQAAIAYSLQTLRPSIFYSPLGFQVPDDLRAKIGFVVADLKEMGVRLNEVLAPEFNMSAEIQKYKFSEIFNFS